MNFDWPKAFVCLGILALTIFAVYVCKQPREIGIFAGGLFALVLYSAIATGWNPFRYDRNQNRHQDAE